MRNRDQEAVDLLAELTSWGMNLKIVLSAGRKRVPEMTEAEIVRCLHAELKDLEAGRPIYSTDVDRNETPRRDPEGASSIWRCCVTTTKTAARDALETAHAQAAQACGRLA